MAHKFSFWGALVASLVVSHSLFSQSADTAAIVGVVSDPTGAVIPGVEIALTHVATGTRYSTTTNETGFYRTPPLRIGEYLIEVESPGFKRTARSGVVLNVGDLRQVDVTLEVGQITETIEVQAAAPLLETSRGSAGTVMENQLIQELPLNGRDYLQLARISAGVTAPAGSNTGDPQGLSVGGSQATQINFMIDGIDNNNQSVASQGGQKENLKPSIDAIQEFKVVTNAYSAEYGRSMGGVVTVNTKSGTNEIHGTAFYFHRNEALDARNFFNRSEEKPPFKRHQYGFSLGGPVVKNKAFFFGDMEWTDVRESANNLRSVPPLPWRQGDFSGFGAQTIYDPETFDPVTNTRQPFAGNIIPADRFDTITPGIVDWWPAPQTNAVRQNFFFTPPRRRDFRRWDARYDQNLTSKDNFYFRISNQRQDFARVPSLPDSPDGLFKQGSTQVRDSYHLAGVYNRVWTPSLVMSVRAGWTMIDTEVGNEMDQPINPILGIDRGHGLDGQINGVSSFSPTGFNGIGGTPFNLINSQTRQLTWDFTWTKGNHTMKFGQTIYWLQSFIFNLGNSVGDYPFDGRFTATPQGSGGEPMADFLLGWNFQMWNENFRHTRLRAPWVHQYFQDDWRVSNRLTLNLGLRYSVNRPWVEKGDRIGMWDEDTDPQNPRFIVPDPSQGWDGRAMEDTDWTNFAPRFGFSYRANDATVLRGAYGIFYGNTMNTGGAEQKLINPPFHIRVLLTTDRTQPSLRVSEPLPALDPRESPPLTPTSFERFAPWPIAQQWNLNIQRQLPGDMMLQIGYMGTKGDHIIRMINTNWAPPGPGDINSRRRFTEVQWPGEDFTVPISRNFNFRKDAKSIYHAMQVKLEKRFGGGLSFLVSYNWSRAIGDYSFIPGESRGANTDWGVQDPTNLKAERSLLRQHLKHRFVGSWVYELPFGQGRQYGTNWNSIANAVLGGWTLGGIGTIQSGFPMNLRVQGNPSNTGDGMDRPNVVGEWFLPRDERGPDRWFNVDAFEPNAPFTFGNAGRNVLIGPGLVNFDLSMYKNFMFSERLRAQLRFEAFNATNTAHFTEPNTQIGNRNAGIISGAGNPRIWQLGLKLIW